MEKKGRLFVNKGRSRGVGRASSIPSCPHSFASSESSPLPTAAPSGTAGPPSQGKDGAIELKLLLTLTCTVMVHLSCGRLCRRPHDRCNNAGRHAHARRWRTVGQEGRGYLSHIRPLLLRGRRRRRSGSIGSVLLSLTIVCNQKPPRIPTSKVFTRPNRSTVVQATVTVAKRPNSRCPAPPPPRKCLFAVPFPGRLSPTVWRLAVPYTRPAPRTRITQRSMTCCDHKLKASRLT